MFKHIDDYRTEDPRDLLSKLMDRGVKVMDGPSEKAKEYSNAGVAALELPQIKSLCLQVPANHTMGLRHLGLLDYMRGLVGYVAYSIPTQQVQPHAMSGAILVVTMKTMYGRRHVYTRPVTMLVAVD